MADRKLSGEPTPLASPLACEPEIRPVLKPTRPPTALLKKAPVEVEATVAEANEFVTEPSFWPTSPPTKL